MVKSRRREVRVITTSGQATLSAQDAGYGYGGGVSGADVIRHGPHALLRGLTGVEGAPNDAETFSTLYRGREHVELFGSARVRNDSPDVVLVAVEPDGDGEFVPSRRSELLQERSSGTGNVAAREKLASVAAASC